MAERELVDVYEGARTTGLAPTTLYKLARQRRIRSFKVLSTLRFDRNDLLALINECPAQSDTAAGHSAVIGQVGDESTHPTVAGDLTPTSNLQPAGGRGRAAGRLPPEQADGADCELVRLSSDRNNTHQ